MSEGPCVTGSPFEGLLVVDVSGTIATGYAGKLFADYGASVVNVEPVSGFSTRCLRPMLRNGNSAMHGYLHANKQSVTSTDPLEHPAAINADLVLLDPGSLSSSVSIADISTNVCAVSWFGLNGPYAQFHGSDGAIHALTGLMRSNGKPGEPPIVPQGWQAQMVGGLSAFNGALGYLLGHLGIGAEATFCIDASIYEANLCLTDLAPILAYNDSPPMPRKGINRFPPTYPLGIWPCKDGWLGVTCLTPSQWHAFCKLLGLDELAEVPQYQSSISRFETAEKLEPLILEALSEHSAEDLFYRGQAMRIPLARVPTMEELFTVDQYVERRAFAEYSCGGETFQGPTVPYRLLKTPPALGGEVADLGANNLQWTADSVPTSEPTTFARVETASNRPLAGLVIIDLSMGWAGPLAARNLADLGAKVIKVESCTRFDWFRSWEATKEWIDDNGAEKAPQYIYCNRNKLDITLDLESDKGRDLLLRLVAAADALIENYSGRVLPRLRLDYQHLIVANPELVMLSMPAFGSTGPWSEFRAYGSTIEHSSGLPHLIGAAHQPPVMQHVAMGDAIAGLNGSAALLTALYHKQRTGKGQYVDLSQAECLFPHAAPGILHQSVHQEPPARIGNRHQDYAPHGVYPCTGEDNWIFLQIQTDAEWQNLCRVIAGLEAFDSLPVQARREQHNEIDRAVAQWTRNRNATSLMHELQSVGISAATLNYAGELLNEPHLLARGYIQMIERDFVGMQPHPSAPWRTGLGPLPIPTSAPTLGQHNQQVLQGMLRLGSPELEELAKSGIIGTRPRLP